MICIANEDTVARDANNFVCWEEMTDGEDEHLPSCVCNWHLIHAI